MKGRETVGKTGRGNELQVNCGEATTSNTLDNYLLDRYLEGGLRMISQPGH